jgi:hypothetical protein
MTTQIDALDRALKVSGQPITLRRVMGTTTQTFTDVVCQAVIRGYSPQQLVSGIELQDSHVIMSPTEINNAVWPYAQGTYTDDVRIPSRNRGDLVIINGRQRAVEAAVGIYLPNNTLVRIEMQVR